MSQASQCNGCSFRTLCISAEVAGADLGKLGTMMRRLTPLSAGEHLYWEGDDFEAVYAVRRGALKTYTTDVDGNERVRGFHLPGDLFALDAIHAGRHPSSAQALAECEICVLPYARLEAACVSIPGLQHRLCALLSRDFSLALAMAGEYTAEQRMAAFLLQLADRCAQAGGSADALDLHMGRRDIGNYLRLVTETVSRVLTRFRDDGLIAVDRRRIRLLDPAALRRLASPVGLEQMSATLAVAA